MVRKKKARTKGENKIAIVMREFGKGKLRSSSGSKVTSKRQALAIAFSEARRAGARIPRRKSIHYKTDFTRVVDRRMKDFGEIDFSKKRIRVNPRRTNRGGITDTVMHEELHREFPNKNEREIARLAKKRLKSMPIKKIGDMLRKFSEKKRKGSHYKTD